METDRDFCKVELGETSIRLSNDIIAVTYDTRMGEITLTSVDDNNKYFTRGYFRVKTESQLYDSRKMTFKSVSAAEFRDSRGEGKAVVLRLHDDEKSAEVNIRLTISKGMAGFTSVVQFRNKTEAMQVESIDTLVIDVDEGNRVFTGWNGKDLMFFKNGFQSWDLSQALPIANGINESHFFTVLTNKSTGRALLTGFLTMANQLTTVSVLGRDTDGEKLAQIIASSLVEIEVPQKNIVVSEEMLVLVGENGLQNLALYADLAAERMEALSWRDSPAGWCSWYYYFTLPNEQDILSNAEELRERYGDNLEWIQIDDGFQKTVGDWDVNSRFPSGLKPLVDKIRKLNYKAGLWLAPFVATEHSELFKDKPEWFVRDDNNNPIAVDQNPLWLGNYYALDLTNPDVHDFLEKTFTRFHEMGFEYFKIDFLFHAAVKGQRYNPQITRGQAVRHGLETVRSAVGEDFILGCGAPLGPCVGIVNGMRIGTDIAHAWRFDWGAGVYECSVNTMSRAVLHNRWWKNDPDCIPIRQDDTNLNIDELRLWLTVVALSGGMLLISEKMDEVSEERKGLVDKMLPIYSKGAIALDAMIEPEPRLFSLPIETVSGSWVVLGVINLSDRSIDVSFKLEDLGLDASKPHHVFDFWDEKYEGMIEEGTTIADLRPHCCKLLTIRPESDFPEILSTTMHFTQGAVELKNHHWKNEALELEVTLDRTTREEESIFFVLGSKWKVENADLDDKPVEIHKIAPEVVSVKSQFKKNQTIRLNFSR